MSSDPAQSFKVLEWVERGVAVKARVAESGWPGGGRLRPEVGHDQAVALQPTHGRDINPTAPSRPPLDERVEFVVLAARVDMGG